MKSTSDDDSLVNVFASSRWRIDVPFHPVNETTHRPVFAKYM